MPIDIPYSTANILHVETYNNDTEQMIFIDSECPKPFIGQIVYYTVDNKIISKGCYSRHNGEGTIKVDWVETGLSEPARPIEPVIPKIFI